MQIWNKRAAVTNANKRPRLSVVFSFRNEEQVLVELIRRMRAVLDDQCNRNAISDYELVFVNDDSTDRSLDILLEHAEGRRDIKIINMSRVFGGAACILAGMKHACGDAVIYMDCDLQDPPEKIPELIAAWQGPQRPDVVHTVRDSRAGESRIKLAVTRLGYRILKHLATIELPIEAGDFKLLSRRAVNHLIGFEEKQPYIRGLVSWIGYKQVQVHYRREPRFAGKTKFPVLSPAVMRNFFDSALISFSDVPLKLSAVIGLIVSLGAFAMIGWIVMEKLRGHNIPGWSAIMVTVLFLGGIQQFSVAFLGLYVKSIYLESKGRPNYIVASTYGFKADAAGDADPIATQAA